MTTFGYDSFFLLPGNQTGKADGRYEGKYINELRSWSAESTCRLALPIGPSSLIAQTCLFASILLSIFSA